MSDQYETTANLINDILYKTRAARGMTYRDRSTLRAAMSILFRLSPEQFPEESEETP